MAYPTGSVAKALDRADAMAIELKGICDRAVTKMAAGNVGSNDILNVYIQLTNLRNALASLSATPGIAAYAQIQKADDQLDIAAEFTAMLNAIDSTTTWVTNNFPKDGNGYLLARTLGPTGPVDRLFTPAQTATFRTVLTVLSNTIAL